MADQEFHVIFGAGPVGQTLAEELVARGKRVRIVSRSGKAKLPSTVEVLTGDASKVETVREMSKGATTIYNCTHAPYHRWSEFLPDLQNAAIEGAAATGAKLVVIDSVYLYGETKGQVMTEETPVRAMTRKGRIRAALMEKYFQAHRDGKIRVTVGRAGDFFGPRTYASLLGETVFPRILAGKAAQLPGCIDLLHSLSYISDVARGLATLGENDAALGRSWHLPIAPAVTIREVLDLISNELGQPVRVQRVPKWLFAVMGLFVPPMGELVEMYYQYIEPQIIDSSAIEQTFGLKATPLSEAIHTTLRWFQEHKGVSEPLFR